MPSPFATHEVFNQPPPLEDVNLFSSDTALMEAVEREGGGDASERLHAFGRLTGSAEAFERGRLANEHPPRLSTHDARGHRRDTVTYHPAYHELMRTSCGEGLHSSVWADLAEAGKAPRPGAHVRRAGAFYMAAQMEAGHCCPITMTNAAVPVLLLGAHARQGVGAEHSPFQVRPELRAGRAEDRRHPRHGHDREAGRHRRARGDDESRAGGASAARAPNTSSPATSGSCRRRCRTLSWCWRRRAGGLTCFLMPRFLPDGSVNGAAFPAPEGQARQPLERLLRGRVRRRARLGHRRGGARGRDHHRDGDAHAARLRARLRRAHAARRSPTPSTTPSTARCSRRSSSTSR